MPVQVEIAEQLHIDIDGLLDQQLTSDGPVRKLGSAGQLTLGNTSIPVDVAEVTRTRGDGTIHRRYAVTPEGSRRPVLRLTASSPPGTATIVPSRAVARLLGQRFPLASGALQLVGP